MLPYNDKNGTSFNDLSVGNRRGGPTQAAPRGRAGRGIRIDHRVAIVKKSVGNRPGNASGSDKINTGVDKTLNIL